MATREELYQALRNADASGDVAGARKLAAYIQSMPPDANTSKKPDTSLMDSIKQGAGNIVAGAVRGAGSIGATILAPIDAAARAAGVQNEWIGRTDRRQAMDEGLKELGANPDSLAYKTGKLGAEVAGTAGAGGLIANGVRFAAPGVVAASPRLAQLASAVESGGFMTGAPTATNALGKAADLGVRIVGGGINGAASAGLVNPNDAATGGDLGAALPGAAKVGGIIGNAGYEAASSAANKLMQSAVKPTIAQLKNGEAKTAVQTLLDYGISPTSAGVNKLRSLIDDINNQIAGKISSSNATVNKQAVVNRLGDVEQRFSNQVAPTSDLSAIRNVADEFMGHPLYAGADIPVQAAQSLKQGTYKVLEGKFGEAGSAATEAQKGLARGLKEEIAQVVPGVGALNAEESRLLKTLSVSERRALMDLNKNPMGFAALATNPMSWAAFMADRSVAFKSLAARMLNRSANAAQPTANLLLQGVAPNPLLRNAAVISGAGG